MQATTAAVIQQNPGIESVPTDERYTPESWLEKVEAAIGPIGLDPTADPAILRPDVDPNFKTHNVAAWQHITAAQNCLVTPWDGPGLAEFPSAYMNPPYRASAQYLRRWADYVASGHIKAGISLTLTEVLSNKRTQNIVRGHAVAVAFPYGRINFVNGGNQNDRDVCFILWGSEASIPDFKQAFCDCCLIAVL